MEEPLQDGIDWDTDAHRILQELAYTPTHQFWQGPSLTQWDSDWEIAQQIAQQLSDTDSFDVEVLDELDRQRQAQIEAYLLLPQPPVSPFPSCFSLFQIGC